MNFDTNTLATMEKFEPMETEKQKIAIDGTFDMPMTAVSMEEHIVKPEEKPEITKLFDRRQSWVYYETDEKKKNAEKPDHVFNNAEYYGGIDKFYFSEEFVRYLKQNPDDEIRINAYGLENSHAVPQMLQEEAEKAKSLADAKAKKAGEELLSLWKPEKEIIARTFKKTEYNSPGKNLAVLSINLPYEYYKDIYIPEKVFEFDDNTVYFCFKDLHKDDERAEIQQWYTDFMAGNYEPPLMKIQNGTILSVEWMVPLFFAKLLHLPYLPAVIIADGSTHDYEKLTPEYKNKELAQRVFEPYLWIR